MSTFASEVPENWIYDMLGTADLGEVGIRTYRRNKGSDDAVHVTAYYLVIAGWSMTV